VADYNAVQDALAKGTDPAMLCSTCPWDRYCITPPTMTRADIEAQITKATALDEAESVKRRETGQSHSDVPVGTLMATLMFAGKDTAGTLCPVFSLRLRSSTGRTIADGIKGTMQKWDDQS